MQNHPADQEPRRVLGSFFALKSQNTPTWEQRKFEEIAVRSSVMSDKKGLPRVEYEDIISGAGRLNKDIKLKESEKVGIVFHKGDVLYGKLRPYLQNWLLASFNGLAVGDFWVLQPQNTDSSFLYRLVQSQQFDEVANQSTGTKMPRADWKLVSKTKFAMPHSVDEQAAIGAYFEHLDTLITLHQRKYEKLVNIKKSMLDKMFPPNGASVPEIRFKGFTDPWEQRKFEEIAVRSSVMSDKKGLPRVEYEDIISGAGRLNKDIKLKESEKVGIVFHKGDVLYGKLRPYLQNWLLASFNGLAVGDFWVLQPQNTDSSFLYRLVQSQQFDEVANQSTGTKMPRADWKLVSKTKFAMPHSVDEQAAIGAYFEHLDTLITLHQRKYEKLVNIKKSMLDKMFPQNGASVPEIRFKGFTDPWEQRKLGEIAVFSKGVGYSKNDLCEEGTPIILYGRLYTKYETCIFDVDTFVKEKAGSVYSKGGEVIVPASGETAEDISIASVVVKPGILLGGDLNIVSPTAEYDSAFLALTISSGATHKYLSSLAQGKSVVHLHNSDIQSVSAKFPTKREQEKIHLLFGKIDTLITLHQRKLEKLQNIKKSCLEKMFV